MRYGHTPDEGMELVRAIESGSVGAWHRFVEDYARLIQAVIRRYLAYSDEEERHDLFVQILVALRRGALARYDARSRLSTWLFLFARSRCIDHLRSKTGRRSIFEWRKRLSPLDRRVFELYFVHRLSAVEVCEALAGEGRPVTMEKVAASLRRIEERIDDRLRRRMAYELLAHSIGRTSARFLEFLDELRLEVEERIEAEDPEYIRFQEAMARAAEQASALLERLPQPERDVITLLYYERRTAREAAMRLRLVNQRRVYTLETRALRMLRRMFDG
jgi:DNA-directed RNA polymerase specialized sigma24 family protein